MGWTVTKLDFDEDTEGPVLPQSPLQPMGNWPAPQSGPVPQRRFINHGHTRTDEEGIPGAATFPAPLALDKTASSEHGSAPGGKRSKCIALLDTRLLTPLHGALIFKALTTKGLGDIPMELAVPPFFFLFKR